MLNGGGESSFLGKEILYESELKCEKTVAIEKCFFLN